jgi:hypothetical protein
LRSEGCALGALSVNSLTTTERLEACAAAIKEKLSGEGKTKVAVSSSSRPVFHMHSRALQQPAPAIYGELPQIRTDVARERI